MSTKTAASIDDLRRLAKRRLPRFIFDFIDGGAETETNLRKNRQAFESIELLPRYLVDVSQPSTELSLFGQRYATPLGISAMGMLNIVWPGADLICARLAAAERIPHMLSTAASTSIEQVAEAANGYAWFQLYVTNQPRLCDELVGRAAAAGYDVMVVTVDTPVAGKRDRDVRNQLRFPPPLTPSFLSDLALHPGWAAATLRAGIPNLANLANAAGGQPEPLAMRQGRLTNKSFTWDNLKQLRDQWKGRLLIKGILHPEDAILAMESGCDGIIVSNHGGRQIDPAPAAIDALPPIARAIGGRIPLLMDSGVRRGADIVRAKALGAEMVLCGRAFAYGLGAAGQTGCQHSFDLLKGELAAALEQLGRPRFAEVDETVLARMSVQSRPRNISVVSSKSA